MTKYKVESEEDKSAILRQTLKLLKVDGFNYFMMSIRASDDRPFLMYRPFKYITFIEKGNIEVELRNGKKVSVKVDDVVRIERFKVKEEERELVRD